MVTGDKEDPIYCHKCDLQVHLKWNNLNYIDFKYHSGTVNPWICLKCNSQLFPFATLNYKTFIQHILNISNVKNSSANEPNNLSLKPPPSLSSLFNKCDNTSQANDHKDPENVVSSKYYDLGETQSMKISNKNSCLSLFHINTCSLNKSFIDLEYLIESTNINFDIIAISETRMLKDTDNVKNINTTNFSSAFTPIESTAGRTLFYTEDHLAYFLADFYKNSNLELTYVKISDPNKFNFIVSCI